VCIFVDWTVGQLLKVIDERGLGAVCSAESGNEHGLKERVCRRAVGVSQRALAMKTLECGQRILVPIA